MVFAVNTGNITDAHPLSSVTNEKEAPAYSTADCADARDPR